MKITKIFPLVIVTVALGAVGLIAILSSPKNSTVFPDLPWKSTQLTLETAEGQIRRSTHGEEFKEMKAGDVLKPRHKISTHGNSNGTFTLRQNLTFIINEYSLLEIYRIDTQGKENGLGTYLAVGRISISTNNATMDVTTPFNSVFVDKFSSAIIHVNRLEKLTEVSCSRGTCTLTLNGSNYLMKGGQVVTLDEENFIIRFRELTPEELNYQGSVLPKNPENMETNPSPIPGLLGTPIQLASPTAAFTEDGESKPDSNDCKKPSGWVIYIVKSGDSLFNISITHQTKVSELQRINCLDDESTITVGQELFVPGEFSFEPTSMPPPSATPPPTEENISAPTKTQINTPESTTITLVPPTPTSSHTSTPIISPEPIDTPEPPPGNEFYVAPNGNDNNPGTIDQPWKSLSKASSAAKAGETIFFRGGTYYGHLAPGNSGTANKWIAFKAYPGETPIIVSEGDGVAIRQWNPSDLTYDQLPSYIKISGFIIQGAGNKGIRIEQAHHIEITNNKISNSGSAGISTNNGIDHILIAGNTIHGNCNKTSPCSSGISIWNTGCLWGETSTCMRMNDGAPGYHIIIKNNIIYDNRNDNSACAAGGNPTDGNGIILDNNGKRNPQTLLMNNLIFHNGGRCVHILNSGNIDVFHNTCYHNVETPILSSNGNAELVIQEAVIEQGKGSVTNVNYRNNIVYGNGDATLIREWSNPTQGWDPDYTADYNLYFNGLLNGNFQTGPHDIFDLDPKFITPSLNPSAANFRLLTSSPAIDSGVDLGNMFRYDFDGSLRDGLWDIGAFEYVGK